MRMAEKIHQFIESLQLPIPKSFNLEGMFPNFTGVCLHLPVKAYGTTIALLLANGLIRGVIIDIRYITKCHIDYIIDQ